MDKQRQDQITEEYNRLNQDEETIHNQDLHKEILATWEYTSPKFYQELKSVRMLDKMAYVVQQRMWAENDSLIKAGFPYTDAREQAERNQLMLEPEEDEDEIVEFPLF